MPSSLCLVFWSAFALVRMDGSESIATPLAGDLNDIKKSASVFASLSESMKFGMRVPEKYALGSFSQLNNHARFTFEPMPSSGGTHCFSYPFSLWQAVQLYFSMS